MCFGVSLAFPSLQLILLLAFNLLDKRLLSVESFGAVRDFV